MSTDKHTRTPFPSDLIPGSDAYYAEALRRTRMASAEGFYDGDAASRLSEEYRRVRDELAAVVEMRRDANGKIRGIKE